MLKLGDCSQPVRVSVQMLCHYDALELFSPLPNWDTTATVGVRQLPEMPQAASVIHSGILRDIPLQVRIEPLEYAEKVDLDP